MTVDPPRQQETAEAALSLALFLSVSEKTRHGRPIMWLEVSMFTSSGGFKRTRAFELKKSGFSDSLSLQAAAFYCFS